MDSGTPGIAALRVATYNVHKCRGMDGRVSTVRIAHVLREVNADVIALQEVVGHQADAIAAELGLTFALGENRRHQGLAYGNVVLSRFPIRSTRNYDLSVEGREQRGCLRADIDLNGAGVLHVFNVHLGTALLERRHQGRRLVTGQLLGDLELAAPRVLMGDFNEWTRGLTTRLLRSHMKSADFRWRSYPGFLPFLHLDHIYYDPALSLDRIKVHRTRLSLLASDHLPLVGDFQVQSYQRIPAQAGQS
jgi:endonuclease/exonuclease/phosphatase family metal-dependent hydrolase